MKKMIAYHGKQKIKTDILKQLKAHHDADDFIKGKYWENGKGCAVGCTVHSGEHVEYEKRFGIPLVLARLEDSIFEGLPNELAKEWPLRFMSAIKPKSDLSKVWAEFCIWNLENQLKYFDNEKFSDIAKINREIQGIYRNYLKVGSFDESAARSAASAARSAASAARSAASAAWSAESAARSAESAAWSAESAESAAWSAAWIEMSDKLIELIKAVK